MAMGKRKPRQESLFVTTDQLTPSAGHPFYTRLNGLLDEAKFDEFAEAQCAPHYDARLGRPSIPPGVYFRMLLVGYFEGLDGQHAIAWRAATASPCGSFSGSA